MSAFRKEKNKGDYPLGRKGKVSQGEGGKRGWGRHEGRT